MATMNRMSITSTLMVATVLLTGCGGTAASPGSSIDPSQPSSTPPAATATAAAPSFAAALPLQEAGQPSFPGTYSPKFQPPLTITIDHVVDLDCAAGYICRGDVDANMTGWLGLSFGNVHGSEIDLVRLDKVYDPAAPSKLIDPPVDLAAWLVALPGTAVLAPPKTVSIGGRPAIQFDVKTPGDLQLGPMPGGGDGQAGIGPNGLRIVLVTVDGLLVLISEWIGADNTVLDRQAALDSVQPLVNSIKWL